jgi:hypothetical protein
MSTPLSDERIAEIRKRPIDSTPAGKWATANDREALLGEIDRLKASAKGDGANIPDLVALTSGDREWTWEMCIMCGGSADITHRGLYITSKTTTTGWAVHRVAWCGAAECQHDRNLSRDTIYPQIPDGGEPC